jgi:hypothetical protein
MLKVREEWLDDGPEAPLLQALAKWIQKTSLSPSSSSLSTTTTTTASILTASNSQSYSFNTSTTRPLT